MHVYYFTSALLAVSNLALCRLKVSRFNELNDPFELLGLDRSDDSQRRLLQGVKEAVNEKVGLLCFSRDYKNPVLWGHYADRLSGMCLGFEVPVQDLTEVSYADEPFQAIPEVVDEHCPLDKAAIDRLVKTKYIDWKYEEEWRLFVDLSRTQQEGGLHFYPFSSDCRLVSVFLGPRCALPIRSLRRLMSTSFEAVIVSSTRLAANGFQIELANAIQLAADA